MSCVKHEPGKSITTLYAVGTEPDVMARDIMASHVKGSPREVPETNGKLKSYTLNAPEQKPPEPPSWNQMPTVDNAPLSTVHPAA